ncbi:ABC-2 transporter permease [Streptomyces cavernicola]|uniref:ABC transporter permease n=1 Tax=Streptomyces cavernicola TaxID=3043613 RepID=A0ABT6SP33_9ACTN|nr:hypothetical protein [Streptomyces sp. B-S-A6]MDI3409193.1 hypothetical protein [Streptomyces sp. B-S-A6]
MCVGMGLAYLGAFASPEPHQMPVAVVGAGPEAKVLAQTLHDKAGDGLDVRTVPSRAAAVDALNSRTVSGAYVMDEAHPELLVATAGSDTSASAVEKVFTKVSDAQGTPLKVTDVAPPASGDPTGQGVFFLLVALSIGSYASVAALGAAGSALPMRLRALLVAGTSFVVSLIGAAFAGPVFHLVDHGLWGVWAMSWLYSAAILFIGVGLHTFLKRWTTLGVMVLFVMLNFTSSGGIFRPELQNGFFASLHAFWNGAGFVEGVRDLVYFDGHGLARNVWVLVAWLAVGLVVMAAAGITERRRGEAASAPATGAVPAPAPAPAPVPAPASAPAPAGRAADKEAAEAEEEMEEAVAV